jgi:hypothetical protein
MPKKPQTIVTQHRANFETLRSAFANGDAALVDCRLKSTGESVAVICAMQRSGEEYQMVPFAMFLNGNPYEMLEPPNPDGGYSGAETEGSSDVV